jgi:hypothetical protein
MREAAEPLDDDLVRNGMAQRLVIAERREQLDGAVLVGQAFAVLEGQVKEQTLVPGHAPIEARRNRILRQGEGQRIGGKGARRAAEHVARELVEDDHEREGGERRRLPRVESAARRLLPETGEALADLAVEAVGLDEPLAAPAPAQRRARRPEPEIEDLGEAGGQLQIRTTKSTSIAGVK